MALTFFAFPPPIAPTRRGSRAAGGRRAGAAAARARARFTRREVSITPVYASTVFIYLNMYHFIHYFIVSTYTSIRVVYASSTVINKKKHPFRSACPFRALGHPTDTSTRGRTRVDARAAPRDATRRVAATRANSRFASAASRDGTRRRRATRRGNERRSFERVGDARGSNVARRWRRRRRRATR